MKIKYSEEYILKRKKWYSECWAYIKNAEYKKATAHAKLGFKLFPNDTIAEFNYYSILADYALSSNSKSFKKLHSEAVAGMKRMLKKTSARGISYGFKIVMKNEYYYQTHQFKKQYYLGINSFKRHGDKHDFYSAGVGAANYAYQQALKNNKRSAFLWANKSIKSWNRFFEINKDYYNPYVHLALAYGVLKDDKKMIQSLKKGAKLSKKPMSYREFAEIIEWVSKIPY